MIHRSLNVVVAIAVLSVACRGGGHADAAQAKPDAATQEAGQERREEHGAAKPAATHASQGDEDGHGHGGEKPSDLDRPVDELLAATCEHGKKTYECDECRYEVGVVRVPARLVGAEMPTSA